MTFKQIVIIVCLPIACVLAYVIFFRSLYTLPFERQYYNDLYDHSQYSIAQSIRTIGDGGVYQVVGDRLVNGKAGIFTIDPQVPPLGKLLIGYSIRYFGNGYVLNIITPEFLN